MRLLLHSEDASYDATTKKYRFQLDRRIDKPKQLRVAKAFYSAATMTAYPLVVYLRSDNLHRLIKDKHTLRLKDDNHEQFENILSTMLEGDRDGRYSSNVDIRRLETDPHLHVTEIDIYFSSNATVLSGRYVVPPVPGVSSAQVEAWCASGQIVFWMDMDRSGAVLNESTGLQALADEDVGNVIARVPSDGTSTFTNSSAGGLTWKPFNANTSGITDQVGGAWESAVDSTSPNFTDPLATGSFIMLWRSPDPLAFEVMWQSSNIDLALSNGSIAVKPVLGVYATLVGGVLAGTDYIVKISWVATLNSGTSYTFDYSCDLIKLSDNSVTSGTTSCSVNVASPTSKRYSTAQTHLDGYYGMTFMTTQDATVDAAVVNYIKQVYSGAATEPVVGPDAVDASFQLELDIDTK